MSLCLASLGQNKTKVLPFLSDVAYYLIGRKPTPEAIKDFVDVLLQTGISYEIIDEIIEKKRYVSMCAPGETREKTSYYSRLQAMVAVGVFKDFPFSIYPISEKPIRRAEWDVKNRKYKFPFLETSKWHHMKIGDSIVFPYQSKDLIEEEIYYLHDLNFLREFSSNIVYTKFPWSIFKPKEVEETNCGEMDDEDMQTAFMQGIPFKPPEKITRKYSSEKKKEYNPALIIQSLSMQGYTGVGTFRDKSKKEASFSIRGRILTDVRTSYGKTDEAALIEIFQNFHEGSLLFDTTIDPEENMKMIIPEGMLPILAEIEEMKAGVGSEKREIVFTATP
jgi:hypothetical protein